MQSYRLIIISVLLLVIQIAFSQTINIEGCIKNGSTGTPVSGALIILKNTNDFTYSDPDGKFNLACNLTINSIIVVSHISYLPFELSITNKIIDNVINIELEESTLNLNEVVILDRINSSNPFRVETVNERSLEETNLSDIGTLLSLQPNVGGIKKGATGIDPVIRGFKYSQISVQIDDGTRIEGGCPNRMDPTASHVSINDISSIKVYKGPFALKYGPDFGGLIILNTYKPIFHDEFKNTISLILGGQTNHLGYRTGIRFNGGNSIVAYNLSANRSSYGNYSSGNGDLIEANSDNYNITGRLGFRVAEGHVLNLSADRSWGRNIDFPALPMDERNDDTQIYRFSYLTTPSGDNINFIKLSAYWSEVNHEMDNKNRPMSDTVVAISKIVATNSGARVAVNINAMAGNLEIGSNYEMIRKDGDRYKYLIMQPGLPLLTEDLWNKAKINNIGMYAEYLKNNEKINWVGAIRMDYNSATSDPLLRSNKNGDIIYENTDTDSEHLNLSFSAGLTWQLNSKVDLEISIGKGTRSPDMTERFIILLPVGYDPYDYLGNPQIKPESNHELDLGINRNCWRSGHFSASVFFSYVSDYISAVIVPPSQILPQTKGVLGVKQFINIDRAYLTGFEVSHSTPESNRWQVRFDVAYTMGMNPSSVKIIYENGEAVDEEIIKNDPLPEIPPFEANIWIKYKFLANKLIPEINYRMVAKQNKVSEAYYEQSTPGFNILNFKLVYNYSKNLNITFGVNNIFNTNYYQHLNRRIIGSSAPYYEPGRIFYTNLIIKL